MLKRAKIKNFKIHRDLELEFSSGFNVIAAPSDSGKSTVLNALRWNIRNKPDGFSFRSWKAKKKDPTSVELEFDDCNILKERSDSKHFYLLNDSIKYEAMRGDVPEEINKLTNIAPHCFQSQFDTYFLLQDSPGEVARKLNEVVGLNVIDDVYKLVNSKESEAKDTEKNLKKDIDNIKSELESLAYIDTIKPIIQRIEENENELEKLDSSIELISNLINDVKECAFEINDLKSILQFENDIISILDKLNELEEIDYYIDQLNSIVRNIHMIEKEKEECEDKLRFEDRVNMLLGYCDELEECKKHCELIESLMRQMNTYKEEIEDHSSSLEELEIEYKKILKEFGFCPWCRREV